LPPSNLSVSTGVVLLEHEIIKTATSIEAIKMVMRWKFIKGSLILNIPIFIGLYKNMGIYSNHKYFDNDFHNAVKIFRSI
jgi:hypothetical protein